jgi:hypothetical protein
VPDRIQQEIEELLARLDTFPPKRPFWSRVRSGIRGFFSDIGGAISRIPFPRLSAGYLLLFAIGAIVLFSLLRPGGESMTLLILGAFVLFVIAFAVSLRRNSPGGRPQEKLWRGKPMDLDGPSVGERLRSWWRRRSQR